MSSDVRLQQDSSSNEPRSEQGLYGPQPRTGARVPRGCPKSLLPFPAQCAIEVQSRPASPVVFRLNFSSGPRGRVTTAGIGSHQIPTSALVSRDELAGKLLFVIVETFRLWRWFALSSNPAIPTNLFIPTRAPARIQLIRSASPVPPRTKPMRRCDSCGFLFPSGCR